MPYFPDIDKIRFQGTASDSPLAFRHYDADKIKRSEGLLHQS